MYIVAIGLIWEFVNHRAHDERRNKESMMRALDKSSAERALIL